MTRVIMTVLGAALIAAMLGTALIDWSRGLPGIAPPQASRQIPLTPGESVWQTMYLPACVPERVELQLAEPVTSPGALAVAWFALENPMQWPSSPVAETSLLLTPGDAHVTLTVPDASRVGARLVGVRLTADRTSITLPTTREEVVATGSVARRAGFVSNEDLAFRADYGDAGGFGEFAGLNAVACVPRTQPRLLNQPAILATALIVVCVAGAWLAALTSRLRA